MTDYIYLPQGVCSKQIEFGIENGKIHNLRFLGGCSGNLRAIAKLLEGMDAKAAADRLRGNQCGPRDTSCADQLAKAIDQALQQG